MTLRHIKIFYSVCENNYNTTKAAQALHMTQPAVSFAISELEQYYGVALFDRIGRRLKITEAGQRFREYSSYILSLFDKMEKGMRNWDSFGILRIGSSITIGSLFLPNYVKAFSQLYPNTDVRVEIGPSQQLEQKIINNSLDFILSEGTVQSSSLVCEPYMEDSLTVIVPADSGYRKGQTISQEEFQNQKFLLRERGSGTREAFDRAVEKAGISVTPIWEAMSTTALVNAVHNGLGIAVIPSRRAINPILRGLVIPINVEDLDFQRKFHIIYHKQKFLTASAKAFMELCRSYESQYPPVKYENLC